jgi:hypothetical protein
MMEKWGVFLSVFFLALVSITASAQQDIDISPKSHPFGAVHADTTASHPFTISNPGDADLVVSEIYTILGDNLMFGWVPGETNPCTAAPITIPPGVSCNINVTFTPDSVGFKWTNFGIASNAPGKSPWAIWLDGVGVAGIDPDIAVLPGTTVWMGSVYVGSYFQMPIELWNYGGGDLVLGAISSPSAPFSLAEGGSCIEGMMIHPGESCPINVKFSPESAASFSGGFTVNTLNDPDEGVVAITLNGVGLTPPPQPDIEVEPSSHPFGPVSMGGSVTQTFTISNIGEADLIINPLEVTGGDETMFALALGGPNPCLNLTPTIPVGANCTVVVTFTPTALGPKSSALRIYSNDLAETPKVVSLSGTGVAAMPDIDITAVSPFGPVRVNGSANQQVTISNTGPGTLSVAGITMTGGDAIMFSVASGGTNPCGSLAPTINAGGNCTLIATFSPTSLGAKSTTMRISSNDPDENLKDIPLSGKGVLFTVAPNEGTYGTQVVIEGAEFGAKNGKVLIGTVALKVSDWGPSPIKGSLGKVMTPGAYDVTIQRKDPKGATPLIEEDAFTVKGPEIDGVSPAYEGTAGDERTIEGSFFGTKKGKVYLAGKSCKVVSWVENEIKFVVPKKLPLGSQELKVDNKVGFVTTSFTVK